MSHNPVHALNPSDAAAHLRHEAAERIDDMRKTAKGWRKAGRREVRRLARGLEDGAAWLGAEARQRPAATGAAMVGGAVLAALAGWIVWRNRRPTA